MRLTKLAAFCYGMGLFVGGAASMGLLFGFEPSRLPPALLDIAAYKLAFIAAFTLLGAGAVVTRYERRMASDRRYGEGAAPAPAQLGAPDPLQAPQSPVSASRERDRV